jgi:hypothetical protein
VSGGSLNLFTLFHLNLAYSSIEEDQRAEVVEKCYWPILRLAEEAGFPCAVEATGYTLECIEAIDPAWIAALRRLCGEGRCELVGSGYAQIIGPLVPAQVNRANQALGQMTYRRLLGFHPALALVGEQAWSAGLVRHYLEAGYRALVMEYDNPSRHHREWEPEWRYLPQRARGSEAEEIPLLWNHSLLFQRFQRYVHGEMELAEYLEGLFFHAAAAPRVLPLYGNDAEVFDFRPGRYHAEAVLDAPEWPRIRALAACLAVDGRCDLLLPSQALELLSVPGAGNLLRLETAEEPIPVKKQGKYNILRWAVTGRDDLALNTECWRIASALGRWEGEKADLWRELCFLWGSDFRTHITQKRWENCLARLDRCGRAALGEGWSRPAASASPMPSSSAHSPSLPREKGSLLVETDAVRLRLNLRRGLAFESLVFPCLDDKMLVRTLPHGYFDDIAWGADFYSGHLVFEVPGRPKVTDLSPVVPEVEEDSGGITVRGTIETPMGRVRKRVRALRGRPRVELEFDLEWDQVPVGSLRLGHVTLDPESFDLAGLFFATHDGGEEEVFPLSGVPIDHGRHVSLLVSASHALGMTEGVVRLGDGRRRLRVSVDKEVSAAVAMVRFQKVDGRWFYRLSFSLREVDDTARPGAAGCVPLAFRMAIEAEEEGGA